MASIKQGKNGRWHVQVRRDGQNYNFTEDSKQDALNAAAVIEAEIIKGNSVLSKMTDRRRMSELIDRYIFEDRNPKAKQKGQLEWWSWQLDRVRIHDVSAKILIEKRALLLSDGRSPATANRYMAALSGAFRVAVTEWEWLADNPCRNVRQLTEPKGRVRFLSPEERVGLLNLIKGTYELRHVVALSLATGARKGDLLKLKWCDVLDDAVIFRDRKNGSTRRMPVHLELIAQIRWIRPGERNDQDCVFPKIDMSLFKRACEMEHIEDFRFHDLRHTFASNLAAGGATLIEIATALGTTLDMVERYAHLTEEHTARVVSDALKDQTF